MKMVIDIFWKNIIGSCYSSVIDDGWFWSTEIPNFGSWSYFISDVRQELLTHLGIEHMLTLAYSKEENGIVERANKEVMRHLRNVRIDKDVITIWSLYIPLVKRIFNASVHTNWCCTIESNLWRCTRFKWKSPWNESRRFYTNFIWCLHECLGGMSDERTRENYQTGKWELRKAKKRKKKTFC